MGESELLSQDFTVYTLSNKYEKKINVKKSTTTYFRPIHPYDKNERSLIFAALARMWRREYPHSCLLRTEINTLPGGNFSFDSVISILKIICNY